MNAGEGVKAGLGIGVPRLEIVDAGVAVMAGEGVKAGVGTGVSVGTLVGAGDGVCDGLGDGRGCVCG